nr:MAG TPA: hypothetical protein [Caudoviricetes sp.]
MSREKRDILLVWKVVKRDILFSRGLNSFNFFTLRVLQLEGFLYAMKRGDGKWDDRKTTEICR